MQLALLVGGVLSLTWGVWQFFKGGDSLSWLWVGGFLLLAYSPLGGSGYLAAIGIVGGLVAVVQRRLLRGELRRLQHVHDDIEVSGIRDGFGAGDVNRLRSKLSDADGDAL